MPVACMKCTTPIREGARFCDTCGSPASPISPLSPGVGGGGPSPGLPARYQVLTFLGRGGMGRVYLCKDTELNVEVAIKVLPAEVAADEEALQQIRREARAAAMFRECPGILSLYGFEQYGDTWYLVMEYAAGGSLHDRLKKEGRLPEVECRRIGAEVADALAFAHRQRVLHRDIKPANILLNAEGRAKVADFGIAKVMADTSARMSLMTVAGTPIYMAPEIVLQKKVDHRADLYSLGCMLFEMSTGVRPFQGAYHEIMAAKMTPGAAASDPRERNPDLGEEFAAGVRRLMAPDSDDRIPTAAACAAMLREGSAESQGVGVAGTATALSPPEARSVAGASLARTVAVRRRPSIVPLWAGGLVLVTASIGAWAIFGQGTGSHAPSGTPSSKSPGGREEASALAPKELADVALDAPAKAPEGPPESPPEKDPTPPPAPNPAPGLVVTTDPPGATITVDGVEMGLAGRDGLLVADLDPAADHVVKAWLDDYAPREQKGVRWSGGERKPLHLILMRLTGFLRIEGGPPGAAVRAERAGGPAQDLALAEEGSLGPVPFDVGEWTIMITKKGFDPWTGSAKVAVGRTSEVVVSPKERDGTLALDTDPPGAEVYDGDALLGTSPFRKRLAAGRHSLRLVHPDSDDLLREIAIRGEETLDLGRLALPPLATLDLSGFPPDVTAALGGTPIARITNHKSGHIELVLSRRGFRPQSLAVTLQSGARLTPRAPEEWHASLGQLDLTGIPDDCVIRLDGEVVDGRAGQLTIEAGPHRVLLSRRGYVPAQELRVEILPDTVAYLPEVKWTRIPGTIDISALPPDVTVSCDGKPLPRTASVSEVEPGSHVVSFFRAGYETPPDRAVSVEPERRTVIDNPTWVKLREFEPMMPTLAKYQQAGEDAAAGVRSSLGLRGTLVSVPFPRMPVRHALCRLTDTSVIVVGEAGSIMVVDRFSLDARWSSAAIGKNLTFSPAVSATAVIGVSGNELSQVSLTDGRLLPGPIHLGISPSAEPVATTRSAFVPAADGGEGAKTIWTFDLTTGLSGWGYSTPGRVRGGMAIGGLPPNQMIYWATDEGSIYGVAAVEADQRAPEISWTLDTRGPVVAGLVVSGGDLLASSQSGFLFRINRLTGSVYWASPHEFPLNVSPVATDRFIYQMGGGALWCHDRASGEVRWHLAGAVRLIVEREGKTIVEANDGSLWSVGEDGTVVARCRPGTVRSGGASVRWLTNTRDGVLYGVNDSVHVLALGEPGK